MVEEAGHSPSNGEERKLETHLFPSTCKQIPGELPGPIFSYPQWIDEYLSDPA